MLLLVIVGLFSSIGELFDVLEDEVVLVELVGEVVLAVLVVGVGDFLGGTL